MSRWKVAIRWLLAPTMVAVIFFPAAGRVDLPMAWALLGVLAAFTLAMIVGTAPGLLKERLAPGAGNRDRLTRPVATALIFMHWIVAGLDVGRFQWSPVPLELQIVGLVGYAVAVGGVLWAMCNNPFYWSAVRIQSDRGHRTVAAGPYRFVRHPGYTATILAMLTGGLALGSWLGLLPLVGVIALFLRRTVLEDRLLVRELAGYADYAGRVRYRLVAGVY